MGAVPKNGQADARHGNKGLDPWGVWNFTGIHRPPRVELSNVRHRVERRVPLGVVRGMHW